MGVMMIVVSALGPMAKAPGGQAMNVRMMIPGMAFYFILAVGFIWLGIGSIRPPLGLDLDRAVVVDVARYGCA